jgi:hypothetical protein
LRWERVEGKGEWEKNRKGSEGSCNERHNKRWGELEEGLPTTVGRLGKFAEKSKLTKSSKEKLGRITHVSSAATQRCHMSLQDDFTPLESAGN